MNQNGYGFALAFLMFSGCRSFVWLVVVRWLLAQDLWPDSNHATPHPQYGSSDAIHMSAFVITVGRGAASPAIPTTSVATELHPLQ